MPDQTDATAPNPLAEVVSRLQAELLETADKAMRMETALRLIRIYAMGEVMLPHSGAVRDWLRDWIDGAHHGPVGGPLLWPAGIGAVCSQLLAWGFGRTKEGYVTLMRAPADGEKVN